MFLQKAISICAIGLLIILIVQCNKNPPSHPIEPAIEFKSASAEKVNEYDTVRFALTFTDGDADLGASSGSQAKYQSQPCDLYSDTSYFKDDFWSLILLDHRDSCLEAKSLPFVTPQGKYPAISGEIEFTTSALACKVRNCSPAPGCPDDTLVYTVFIKDRAGHLSNGVVTPPIIINCN
ncbi:MAG: hypothetical protein M9931_07520 [Chitinophagales bacterium]|nr:hypothetical protein [Chitinophagales bacterium]OJV27567.1 MAG: hypothetical protein BGO32_03040 [Bacteroidetes bacterium 37-13]HRN95216.1 hypothetical protein [Chitinophagales bacterium]HRP39664.1 hypothetical protein [Chitinophagales bacterium]